MTFAHPELLWALLLAPIAGFGAAWVFRIRLRALERWTSPALWDRLLPGLAGGSARRRSAAAAVLLGVVCASGALGLARPRFGEQRRSIERRGIDIVFVLDSSLSMAARDVAPSRLILASSLIRRLVRELPGNRLAVIQSEGESVVLSPLTVDAAVVDLVLDAIEPGSLPVAGSRLNDGIDRAMALFPAGAAKHRAIVLLSDGEFHGEALPPIIERLKSEHIVVHTIGVGTRAGAPLPLPGGAENEFKRDEGGQVVVSRLSPATLQELAKETGGEYVAADRSIVELAPILTALRSM